MKNCSECGKEITWNTDRCFGCSPSPKTLSQIARTKLEQRLLNECETKLTQLTQKYTQLVNLTTRLFTVALSAHQDQKKLLAELNQIIS